jgi:hypothetical protein
MVQTSLIDLRLNIQKVKFSIHIFIMEKLSTRFLFLTVHSKSTVILHTHHHHHILLQHYSFFILARRKNITEDKIVLWYDKSGEKLDLVSFLNSAVSINLKIWEKSSNITRRSLSILAMRCLFWDIASKWWNNPKIY